MTKRHATFLGFCAVMLWSLLALMTVGTEPIPPLMLNTMCFAIGGSLGLIWAAATKSLGKLRQVPIKVYVFGTIGLSGYHLLYFSALRLAPAAEAGLIAYLWPLLIVLFSGLLPGETLKPGHVVGALIGFAGAALIISGGGAGFQAANMTGYGLALLAAFTWSTYSVLSRRLGSTPTASVAVFCLGSVALSAPLHMVFEETLWPTDFIGWISTIGLGLGPVGLAFYVWDIGVKKGDIQLLGAASYAAPVLSTLALVAAGITTPGWTILIAACLVTGGAVIAARASMS